MVTTGQMTGYAMAIALPLLAALIPFCIFWKRSSKIERGMLGAVGYGLMGYFWQGRFNFWGGEVSKGKGLCVGLQYSNGTTKKVLIP